jgi:adenylate cyclase, class 2
VTVTYKGRPMVARHKTREELELVVTNAPTMGAIFERLGYRPVFRYDKYRTEYRQNRGTGLATLDETPVGIYVELEGTAAWIDRTARRMGFGERDYITASYARLYLQWCEKSGVKPSNMVFG